MPRVRVVWLVLALVALFPAACGASASPADASVTIQVFCCGPPGATTPIQQGHVTFVSTTHHGTVTVAFHTNPFTVRVAHDSYVVTGLAGNIRCETDSRVVTIRAGPQRLSLGCNFS